MLNNNQVVEQAKQAISAVKMWKNPRQKLYLLEYMEELMPYLPNLSIDEKKEIVYHSMRLSKKSYMNVLAKKMNIDLNEESLKIWSALEYCNDNTYALQIINNKKNWSDYANNEYFFEQVVLFSRKFYIGTKEKQLCTTILDSIAKKTDVGFWLSLEPTTNLSKLSYLITKYEPFGEACYELLNIKPGWLNQDYYNIVNKNLKYNNKDSFTVEENSLDWNKIIKNNENYNLEAKMAIRKILDQLWFQKTLDGKYVFESEKISFLLLSKMWILNENHLKSNILTGEEKAKLLQKSLNDKNAFIYIKSEKPEGLFLRELLKACFEDTTVNWNNINFTDCAWRALKISENDRFVHNLILKSKLEYNLVPKNIQEKKPKI